MLPSAKDHSSRLSSAQTEGAAKTLRVCRSEALLRATGQVLYEYDPVGGKIALFGDVERLLGSPGSEFQGSRRRWLQRVPPDDRPRLVKMETAAVEGQPQCVEYRFCRKDGSVIFLRDTCSFVRNKKTKRLCRVGALLDITEQRNLLAQLQHLQKKQVLGELAGGVAHDFNNLLTVFSGYTELLQSECGQGGIQGEYLEELANAVERAKGLTSQLLNFSRDARNSTGMIQLGAVMLALCRMLGRIVPKNIEWVTDIEENSGWVAAEHRHIEAILINLVLNACDAMPQGGRLGVKLANTTIRRADRRVLQGGLKPGSYVQITVSDTGTGMDETVRVRIFEPFFTTKGGASGLGLSLCSSLVEHIGGKITVESTPGRGSVFRIFLPRVWPPTSKKIASPRRDLPLGKGESLLIVEDDSAAQKVLATMLRRLKYKVWCASNGDEALRVIAQNRNIRLVISDLVMPLMGGLELAKKLRKGLPELKIVLTSAYSQTSEMFPAKDPQTIFLPKPFSYPVLAYNLRELLDA